MAFQTDLTIPPQLPIVAAGTVQRADKEIAVEVVAQHCTSSETGTEDNDVFEILVNNQAGMRMTLAALVLLRTAVLAHSQSLPAHVSLPYPRREMLTMQVVSSIAGLV